MLSNTTTIAKRDQGAAVEDALLFWCWLIADKHLTEANNRLKRYPGEDRGKLLEAAAAGTRNNIVDAFAPLYARPGITRESVKAAFNEVLAKRFGRDGKDLEWAFNFSWGHATRHAKKHDWWRDFSAGLAWRREQSEIEAEIEADIDAITGYAADDAAGELARDTHFRMLRGIDVPIDPVTVMHNAGWKWAEAGLAEPPRDGVRLFAGQVAEMAVETGVDIGTSTTCHLITCFIDGMKAWAKSLNEPEIVQSLPSPTRLALEHRPTIPMNVIPAEKVKQPSRAEKRAARLAADLDAMFNGEGQ